ncbi:hypothetical protein QFZ68_007439 [Streptomyces sp. V1I6]|nr:hypothetical protein [Streptomyces sp. V1I6]
MLRLRSLPVAAGLFAGIFAAPAAFAAGNPGVGGCESEWVCVDIKVPGKGGSGQYEAGDKEKASDGSGGDSTEPPCEYERGRSPAPGRKRVLGGT